MKNVLIDPNGNEVRVGNTIRFQYQGGIRKDVVRKIVGRTAYIRMGGLIFREKDKGFELVA